MSVDISFATSGIVKCLRDNLTDPESRASGAYWVDSTWISERLFEHHFFPQVSVFEVGSSSYESRKGNIVYFPLYQIDVYASGKQQKSTLADEVKKTLLRDKRVSLSNSGIKIDALTGENDVIEDERLPMQTFRKTMMFATTIYSSGS